MMSQIKSSYVEMETTKQAYGGFHSTQLIQIKLYIYIYIYIYMYKDLHIRAYLEEKVQSCLSTTIQRVSDQKSTLIVAIEQGFFKNWSRLTVKNVKTHLAEYIPIQLSHLKQSRHGMVFTKSRKSYKQTNMLFAATYDTKSKIYIDLMGRFLILSRAGNEYIFI